MAGPYGVRTTGKASSNLDEIFAHVARESPQNATAVLQQLLDAIFSLKMLPHRYKVYRRAKDALGAVHSMPVPPYVIYYRVIERTRVVRVLTVMHGRQRRPRSFE
jgi:plasmid stabilization system protein ParE